NTFVQKQPFHGSVLWQGSKGVEAREGSVNCIDWIPAVSVRPRRLSTLPVEKEQSQRIPAPAPHALAQGTVLPTTKPSRSLGRRRPSGPRASFVNGLRVTRA